MHACKHGDRQNEKTDAEGTRTAARGVLALTYPMHARAHTHTCLASAFRIEFVGVWGIPACMYFLYAVLFCVMVKSRLAPDRKWQSLIQAAARPRIIKTGRFQDNMLNRFSRGKLHRCDVVDIVADAIDDGMLSSGDLFFKILGPPQCRAQCVEGNTEGAPWWRVFRLLPHGSV